MEEDGADRVAGLDAIKDRIESRDGCVVDFARLPVEVAWGQGSLNPTSVAASKLVTEPAWEKKPDATPPAKPPAAAPK